MSDLHPVAPTRRVRLLLVGCGMVARRHVEPLRQPRLRPADPIRATPDVGPRRRTGQSVSRQLLSPELIPDSELSRGELSRAQSFDSWLCGPQLSGREPSGRDSSGGASRDRSTRRR